MHSRAKLVIAVAVSLLVHVTVAWSVYDHTVVRLDVSGDDQQEHFVRIRRAAPQTGINPAASHGPRKSTKTSSPQDPVNLEQLSQHLLSNDEIPEHDPGQPPQITIRSVKDQRPQAGQPTALQIEAPQFHERTQLIEELIDVETEPMQFVETARPGGGGGPGDATSQARHVLADSGLITVRPTSPGEPVAPASTEKPPADNRPAFNPIQLPDIDPSDFDLAAAGLRLPQHLDNDFDYALHVFKPRKRQFGSDDKTRYFRVDITGRRSLGPKLRTMAKDVVFLIDVSGSIKQPWIDATILGVKDALSSLNRHDRINIVKFSEAPAFFNAESNQPVNQKTIVAARRFLTDAQSGGFTDVNRAINQLLRRDIKAERVYEFILISDGRPTRGVKDTADLINLITRDNNLNASIYCVGIGARQQRDMLEFLAYRNKGYCVFTKSSRTAAQKIRELVSRLRHPIIKDVTLHITGVRQEEVFPHQIPNIHDRETVSIFGRFEQQDAFTMRITGTNHGNEVALTFRKNLKRAKPGDQSIAHEWAFWKLHHMYNEYLLTNDEKIKRQIIRFAREHKLETVYVN